MYLDRLDGYICIIDTNLIKEIQNSRVLTDENSEPMKKIEAIIRLSMFEKVRDALAGIGVRFFTLKDVKGYGLQGGKKMMYRGSVYDSDYIARLQLDILTTDDKIDEIVTTIKMAGRTGEVGDGKIIAYDVNHVTRIRTGEIDAAAI